MNVLIDANVALDFLLDREPHHSNAYDIMAMSENGMFKGFISADSVTTIVYVAMKNLRNKNLVMELLAEMLHVVKIAEVAGRHIYKTVELKWDDFEDALQFVVAESISADFIVTRNTTDYASSDIAVLLPEQFIELLTSEEN